MSNIPQRIGNYNLERKIGKGGQSEVWLGRHRSLADRLVAIKLLMSQDEEWVERFAREATITSRLHHPNIVQILDHGYQSSFPYTMMEYVAGGALRDLLKARQKLPLDEALHIFRAAGTALDYAHVQGVIHRDISPGNILVEQPTGRVLLTDFGIARESGKSGATTFNKVMGTPGYLSPEHAQSATAVTPLSDIYALGVVLFEMLTGVLPWDHLPGMPDSGGGLFGPPRPLREAGVEGLPLDVDRVIQTMLALEPSKRYPTAGAAVQELERVLNRHTSPTQVISGGKSAVETTRALPAPLPELHPVERSLALDLLKEPMQRAQQRADKLRSPAEIAAVFNAWSERGRLRRRKLGRQAAFQRVTSTNCYTYTLNVLYEVREPARTVVEPDHAAAPLPHEKELDRWHVELPAPKGFADEPGGTVRLPGSSRVVKCETCAGVGRVKCTKCKGEGRIRVQRDAPAAPKPVPVGGTSAPGATKLTADAAPAAISGAAAQSAVASPRKIEAVVPCPECNGTGGMKCKPCAGEGRLLERKMIAWSRRMAAFNGHDAVPVDEGWLRQMCQPLDVYRERQVGDARAEWQGVPALTELLAQARAKTDDTTRIALTEVAISFIPITEVQFDLDGVLSKKGQTEADEAEYQWYICGFENQLQDDWRFLNWDRILALTMSALAVIMLLLVLVLIIRQ